MFELNEIDSSLNIFAEAGRPLNIQNLNSPPVFAPISTRIPTPQALKSLRKDFTEIANQCTIDTELDGHFINPDDIAAVQSENFNRDFARLTLPSCNQEHVPIVEPEKPLHKVKPNWHCDVPTTNMKLQKKITYHDVMQALITHDLPVCSCCQNKVEYPFYASPEHQLCMKCYTEGKLPNYTSTRDFFIVKKPSFNDGSWSLSETNKLLSFIEEFGDDWQTISTQMKNRSPSECLLHFVRLPIIDQYYCDDIEAVDEEQDDMTKVLPFMMAPHPIAAYVEFVHLVNHKLGSAVAENSQKIIEERLKANSSVIPFNQVPEILTRIIEITKREAAKLACEEAEVAADMISTLSKRLQSYVLEQFKQVEIKVKQNDTKASEVGFSVPADSVRYSDDDELNEQEEEDDED